MNQHLRQHIDDLIRRNRGLGPEELAELLVDEYNVTRADPRNWANARASAVRHIKTRMAEVDGMAEAKRDGRRRLQAEHGATIIDVDAPPNPGAGPHEPAEEMLAYVPGSATSDELDGIRRFILKSIAENTNLPPEKPEVTLRALLADLEDQALL